MLPPELHAKLVEELRLARYNGMTETRAREALNLPRQHRILAATGTRMDLVSLTALVGADAARSFVTVLKAAVGPDIFEAILQKGVDPGHARTREVLTAIKTTAPAQAATVDAIIATAEVERVVEDHPRLMDAFTGVPGMPNAIDAADFTDAWWEARP